LRGINYFKKGYQPRANIVKDEKDEKYDLVTDSYSILARWRNCFSQLLNVHGVNNVRQTEIYTAEPLVHDLSAFEFEMAIVDLKRHKSPGIDHIPAELITARGRTICSVIHKLIISIWNKEELPEDWKKSVIVPIYKQSDKTGCNNYRGISLLSTTYKFLSSILLPRLTPHQKGSLVWFQLLIIYPAFLKYLRKYDNTMKQCISYL
jgi:hypothetical protein